jgi:hypothetical protein
MLKPLTALAAVGALTAAATAQPITLTAETTLVVEFETSGASPVPDMLNLLLGLTTADATGTRTCDVFDGAELLGTHAQALFGGVVGPLSLNPVSTFRTDASLYTFFDAAIIDMSSLIAGTTEGRFELAIEQGSLVIETANIAIAWGQALGPSSYRVASPDPVVTDIYLLGGPDCYADCDQSGELDFFDFLCFQNAFAAGEPYADCDESGDLDFFDFLCFQDVFATGCP